VDIEKNGEDQTQTMAMLHSREQQWTKKDGDAWKWWQKPGDLHENGLINSTALNGHPLPR